MSKSGENIPVEPTSSEPQADPYKVFHLYALNNYLCAATTLILKPRGHVPRSLVFNFNNTKEIIGSLPNGHFFRLSDTDFACVPTGFDPDNEKEKINHLFILNVNINKVQITQVLNIPVPIDKVTNLIQLSNGNLLCSYRNRTPHKIEYNFYEINRENRPRQWKKIFPDLDKNNYEHAIVLLPKDKYGLLTNQIFIVYDNNHQEILRRKIIEISQEVNQYSTLLLSLRLSPNGQYLLIERHYMQPVSSNAYCTMSHMQLFKITNQYDFIKLSDFYGKEARRKAWLPDSTLIDWAEDILTQLDPANLLHKKILYSNAMDHTLTVTPDGHIFLLDRSKGFITLYPSSVQEYHNEFRKELAESLLNLLHSMPSVLIDIINDYLQTATPSSWSPEQPLKLTYFLPPKLVREIELFGDNLNSENSKIFDSEIKDISSNAKFAEKIKECALFNGFINSLSQRGNGSIQQCIEDVEKTEEFLSLKKSKLPALLRKIKTAQSSSTSLPFWEEKEEKKKEVIPKSNPTSNFPRTTPTKK